MYKYHWYQYLIIVILMVFQPFLSVWFQIANIKLDFLLIFMIISLFNKEKKHAIIIAIITGFIYDLLYSHFFGPYVIVLVVATISIWGINKIASIESIIYFTIYGIVITYIIGYVKALFTIPISEIINNFHNISYITFYQSLYSGAVFLIVGIIHFIISIFRVNKVLDKKGAYNG